MVMPFNGMSPSGDVEADVVYANYGTPEDFEKLDKLKIDVRGKIVAGALRPELSRRESFRRAGARRGRRSSSIPILPTTAGGAATNIPMDRGVPIPACSAGRSDTCSSFPAIRRLRASRRFRRCPTSQRISPETIGADAEDSGHAAFVSRCLADPASISADRIRRASGKARCPSPITSVPGRRR